MGLKVGNIVTVMPKKWELSGQQGEVVATDSEDEDGPIVVHFPKGAFFHYIPPEDDRNRCFEERELRVDTHYTAVNVGKYFFPNHHHSAFEITYPFTLENDCMHEGCDRKCVRRITFNFWGSIHERDLCEEHAEMWDRKMTETGPPMKEDYKPVNFPTKETA